MNVFEFAIFAGWVCCVSYGSIVIASATDLPLWFVVLFVTLTSHSLMAGLAKIWKKARAEGSPSVDGDQGDEEK